MKKTVRFSPEIQERAVRMVVEARDQHESQWAAIVSISAKIGCTAETLRQWGACSNALLRQRGASQSGQNNTDNSIDFLPRLDRLAIIDEPRL